MHFDARSLADLVERVGVGGAIVLMFAFGVGVRLPSVLKELKGIYEIYSRSRIERLRIENKIESEKRRILKELDKRNP